MLIFVQILACLVLVGHVLQGDIIALILLMVICACMGAELLYLYYHKYIFKDISDFLEVVRIVKDKDEV